MNRSKVLTDVTIDAATPTLLLANLTEGVTYTVSVAAANRAGYGPYSTPATLRLDPVTKRLDQSTLSHRWVFRFFIEYIEFFGESLQKINKKHLRANLECNSEESQPLNFSRLVHLPLDKSRFSLDYMTHAHQATENTRTFIISVTIHNFSHFVAFVCSMCRTATGADFMSAEGKIPYMAVKWNLSHLYTRCQNIIRCL